MRARRCVVGLCWPSPTRRRTIRRKAGTDSSGARCLDADEEEGFGQLAQAGRAGDGAAARRSAVRWPAPGSRSLPAQSHGGGGWEAAGNWSTAPERGDARPRARGGWSTRVQRTGVVRLLNSTRVTNAFSDPAAVPAEQAWLVAQRSALTQGHSTKGRKADRQDRGADTTRVGETGDPVGE